MIPSHRDRSARADEAVSLLLVAGATPHCDWQRLLPLFERAGCTLPVSALLEEWQASAHGSAALGQSGVAMLHAGLHHQSLRSATATLLGACLSPVLLSVEDMDARPEFWLDELPGSRLLMLHSRPETALVIAMNEEGSPEEALAQWMSAADAMVRLFRRHRTRVALIDVECALASPIDFLRNCKTSFGLNPLPYSAVAVACDRAGSDIQYLIAAQMVAQSRETQNLIVELEACSLPIGEPATPPPIDCQALYARHNEEHEQLEFAAEESARYRLLAEECTERLAAVEQSSEATIGELRKRLLEEESERETLVQQLKNLRNELEVSLLGQQRQSRDNKDLMQLQESLRSDLVAMISGREAQEKAYQDLTKENQILLARLHRVQHALESAIENRRRQSGDNEGLLRQIEHLSSDFQTLVEEKNTQELRISELVHDLSERSTKITALKAQVAGQEEVARALMQDNKGLIMRLHRTQEFLEENHIALKMVNGSLSDRESEISVLEKKLRSLNGKLSVMSRKLQFRERRIRYMEDSRSWRITKPIRNVMKIFYRSH